MAHSQIILLSSMQPEASSPTKSSGGGAMGPSGCAANLGLTAVMILVFYFLILRPQQKRQRQHEDLMRSLKRGTIVRTSGGIRGEVVDVNERDATLLIADKVKVNVLRSNIATIENPAEAGAAAQVTKGSKTQEKPA